MENKVNEDGLNLLKSFEKLRLKAYDDAKPNYNLTENTKILGHLTIGWGHTGKDVKWNSKITEIDANKILEQDLKNAETIVHNLIKIKLNDNQYSALVSFAYNSGGGFISKTTSKWTPYELWRYINEGRTDIGAKWLKTAITSKGVKMNGLVARRKAEYDLFAK
jgi:lysozyme